MWRLKGGVGNGMEFDTHANVSFSAGELELRANLLTFDLTIGQCRQLPTSSIRRLRKK